MERHQRSKRGKQIFNARLEIGPYAKTPRKILLLEEPVHCSRAPGRGFLGAGAIFSVSEATESILQLIYDSPIVYGLWKGVCTESAFTGCATAVSSVAFTNADILIKSDISSWPKPHFRPPLNLALYTTSAPILRLLIIYPIYVLLLTLLITCFEAKVFSIGVFGAIFAILTAAALAAHLVLYFQYLRKRILYMQSFDDQLDPKEEWWVTVDKYMVKVRWWRVPLQIAVFKIVVCCVKAWKPLQKDGVWFSAAEQREGGVGPKDLTRNSGGAVPVRGEV
ncbi:uncharacterized protein BDZ99DRAFT_502354 [Mytilinidion resinicola]|uniref:Uncharacterized protein n=1 Tax=Mytilinidion resinicola TaxID=574789 RepID=A0A6A6YAA7_9PEZI|nr:uncharacterized protein BDZ99DRAFT_502354 [Mytilinidion resinicola]KAF2804934.1 hypothetical protein BDZ99DRAFT_502354 [Mytilinidion resinicola]